jgi:hypothetical protein
MDPESCNEVALKTTKEDKKTHKKKSIAVVGSGISGETVLPC